MADATSRETLLRGFEEESRRKAVDDVRVTCLATMVFYPLFILLDYFIYPQFLLAFATLRVGVVATAVAAFFLVQTRIGRAHPLAFAVFMYLLCGLPIVVMIHMGGGYASPYFAGINLVLLGLLFILPLGPGRTALICLILYGLYLAPILIRQRIADMPLFVNNNFFLVSFSLVVIVSAYMSTRMRLREFTARQSLARANEELKTLDTLKSQFFANVSHEVRTPLTSILAPIQSLYQGDIGTLSEEQHGLIAQAYRNAVKLLDMINQMLDFSKYEARKMQLRLRRLDLFELTEDTVSLFREVTERKGIRLFCVKDTEPGVMFLDAEKVERILTNLVRNAIKFTEEGSITIRVGRQGRNLYLEIRDTGVGIPQAHLSQIFQRFQQVDGTTTRKFEGTGLGLTIVKEAVELMHGSIGVQSEEGRGTVFRVELPGNLEVLAKDAFIDRRRYQRRQEELPYEGEERRKAERREDAAKVSLDDLALMERQLIEREEEPAPEDLPLAPPADHVLLVEDNVDLRNLVRKMLQRFGHRVSSAQDGLEGWEQLQREPPDVIVSDIMMPRMDGYELVQKIKGDPRTSAIPIILLTARTETLKGLKSGAVDYLIKPVNIRELDARISNLVNLGKLKMTVARQEELQTRMEELSMSFSQSLEMRDYQTAGHSRDVLEFGTMIAQALGMDLDQTLRDSLLLHDIGKLGIDDQILRKPAPLSKAEWEVMKQHPRKGADLLGKFESYREVSRIVLAHQEHFDGSGYPQGLKGEEIPLIARIIAVADAYHAMTSDRPYRRALTPPQAAGELLRGRGTQFDPQLVDLFVQGLVRKGVLSRAQARAAGESGIERGRGAADGRPGPARPLAPSGRRRRPAGA